MATRSIIGVASGSGAEAVEAALVEVTGVGVEMRARVVQSVRQPVPRDLRDLLLRLSGGGPCEARFAAQAHRLLGETYAAAARQAAERAGLPLQRIHCLGLSGHPIAHDPEGRFPAALQLGMGAIVAERIGITTVTDFLDRDLAAGGQGVPVHALADYVSFRSDDEHRLLIHLGGTARVVFLAAGGVPREILGFEAGPCNLLLDGLVRHTTSGREAFDAGGKHAVQGRCIEPLLERWLSQPYVQRRPPKSLPRHQFGDEFARQTVQLAREKGWGLHDLLCTATHFVAGCIVQSVGRFIPQTAEPMRVLLSGGGVRNGFLWHLLEQQFPGRSLQRTDACGVPVETRKALAAAVLAAFTVDGVPANLPSVTGAVGSRLLGTLTPGSSLNWSRCLAWMAQQTAVPVAAYQ